MNRKTLFAFVAVGSLSTVCNAQTWNGNTSTDFYTASNWTPAAVPSTSAIVTIPGSRPNYPVLNAATSVGGLHMQNGAVLRLANYNLTVADAADVTLEAGSLLRVDGTGDFVLTAGTGPAEIAGEIHLEISGSAMMINDTVELIGHSGSYGKIVGQNVAAQIQIADAETLVNGIAIEGSLQVTSDDDLSYFVNKVLANDVNSGRVSAFSSDVFEFADEVQVSDDRDTEARDPLFQAVAGRLVILKTWNNSLNYNFNSEFSIEDCGEMWVGEGEYIYTDLAMPSFSGTVRTDLGAPSSADLFSDDNVLITADFTTLDCD